MAPREILRVSVAEMSHPPRALCRSPGKMRQGVSLDPFTPCMTGSDLPSRTLFTAAAWTRLSPSLRSRRARLPHIARRPLPSPSRLSRGRAVTSPREALATGGRGHRQLGMRRSPRSPSRARRSSRRLSSHPRVARRQHVAGGRAVLWSWASLFDRPPATKAGPRSATSRALVGPAHGTP